MSSFIDKISAGVSKGATSVSAHSKAVLEKTKIHTQLKKIEKERAELLQDLGLKVFEEYQEMFQIDADDGIIDIMSEIANRNEAITEKQNRLRYIDEETKTAIKKSTATQAKAFSFNEADELSCGCGQINKTAAKFCAACGDRL